ncbi:hypothetical protein HZH66_003467 [Vespula vulgaris]|uniref:Uncharacterized protein n=1 Tax=Vespula vulgaris TaxID=7454 RepID=A0A834KF15_VESVU|nr:hypothetical protein HZH66_003467 [Vespula vulgaris]
MDKSLAEKGKKGERQNIRALKLVLSKEKFTTTGRGTLGIIVKYEDRRRACISNAAENADCRCQNAQRYTNRKLSPSCQRYDVSKLRMTFWYFIGTIRLDHYGVQRLLQIQQEHFDENVGRIRKLANSTRRPSLLVQVEIHIVYFHMICNIHAIEYIVN